MLEGLDKVDWAKLEHFHKPATDVPEIIRRLAEGDIGAIRDLFDDDLPPGYFIDGVTPFIIPFMLEILADGKESFKGALLDTLNRLVYACKFGLSQDAQYEWEVPRFAYAKRCIATYEEIAKGTPLYQHNLANHPERRAKYEAADMLSNFDDDGVKIADYFCERIKKEVDDTVIASLLYNMGKLITTSVQLSGENVYDRKKYLQFLYELIEGNRSTIVNVGAALCAIHIARRNVGFHIGNLPPFVIQTLERELLRLAGKGEELEVFMVPVYSKERIASHLARVSVDTLLVFLETQENRLDAINAHLIIRELLDIRIRRMDRTGDFFGYEPQDQNIAFWSPIKPVPLGHFYTENNLRIKLFYLGGDAKKVLEFLVDYNKFWELPTNLLSFFYGLPDSREELRKLIAES